MTARQKLDPAVAAIWEERLSPDEFSRRVAEALAETDEIERQAALIRWFSRRYPTAKERLAYVRRKYAEWTRTPTLERGDVARTPPRSPSR